METALDTVTESETATDLDVYRFVATNCACCGLPLRDAVSVQRAIGPECYGKYYSADTPSLGDAGWSTILDVVTSTEIEREKGLAAALELPSLARDNRALANVCIRALAMPASDLSMIAGLLVKLIALAGFDKTAERISKRLEKTIERHAKARSRAGARGHRFAAGPAKPREFVPEVSVALIPHLRVYAIRVRYLSTEQFGAYIAAMRSVPERRFDRNTNENLVPTVHETVLLSTIRQALPGVLLTLPGALLGA